MARPMKKIFIDTLIFLILFTAILMMFLGTGRKSCQNNDLSELSERLSRLEAKYE